MRASSVLQQSLATAAFVLCVATPFAAAYAQSPRQFWIEEQRRQQRQFEGYRYRPWDEPRWNVPGLAYAPFRDEGQERRAPQPHVEVDSPKYYTYEPDALRTEHFDDLCKMGVASNTPVSFPGQATFAGACVNAPELTLRVLPEVGDAIRTYYADHPGFIWSDSGAVNPRAQAAMAALADAARFGLSPADYQVALPGNDSGPGQASAQALLQFDIALSAKVLTYVLDATRGRVAPDRISGYHDLPRKSVDLAGALSEIVRTVDVAGYLASRNPDNPRFRALVATLQRLQGSALRRPITIAEGTRINPGDSSAELANVVAAIEQNASPAIRREYAGALSSGKTAERYDGKLVELVRDFQREKGLSVDGIIGPNTVRAITADSRAEKIGKLRLAMERLRWLPRDFGDRYVFLNQPAFEVTYFNGAQPPLSMPVIIGQPSRQTYFFTDRIEAVEYNPYWNVPRSILVNEMLPKLYRDPGYLDRAGYEVSAASGRAVSSSAVDWAAVALKQTSVDVRQPPGARNALGRLKIKFPNAHAIYMHDTPQKSLFEHARRAFSHGCVRLRHPREMAAALLDKPVAYVDRRIAEGENAVDPVEATIPVYLAYFTAWPDEQGTVHYYDDVYGRDDHLQQALEKTEAARRGSS